MSTYSNLKFELITTGEQSGTWGITTDTNIGTAIEQAIVGMATLDSTDFSSNVATLVLTNTNAAQEARALCIVISAGSTTAAGTLNVPAIEKPYIIINNTSYALTVKVSGLTGVSVPAGKRTVVYNNGTDVGDQITYLSSLTLGTALPVDSGGTGGNTAATGRTGLGATTVGGNLFTLTNPSAVTYLQINADNTVTALDSTAFKSALGISGSGSVTSVSGTGTVNGITLSGTVTSTGNLTLGGTLSGVSLTSQVTGTLPLANGGTGGATQQLGLNNLAGAVTSGSYLRGNGTNVVMSTIQAGDVPTLNQNTTGSAGSVATTNWSVVESGGYLYFKNGGVNKMRLDSSGNLVVTGNVTAYGSI
jgi:hypothetical protein